MKRTKPTPTKALIPAKASSAKGIDTAKSVSVPPHKKAKVEKKPKEVVSEQEDESEEENKVVSRSEVEESNEGESNQEDGGEEEENGSEVDEEDDDESEKTGDGGEEKEATFASLGLNESLVTACRDLGWANPTPIQAKAIPVVLSGKDVIALAETGSGKTGAFALPILHRLISDPKRLSALVLAPTRELAVQIHDVFQALGNGIGAMSVCIVGGVDMVTQAIQLAKRPHIVTGTPGRLVDHLKHTKGFSLRDVKSLVLDEADRMLSMDFEDEINTILSVIPREGRTTMLFSATMTSKVQKLQRASVRPGNMTVRVQVSEKYGVVKNLDQKFLFVPATARDKYLVWLLHEFSGKSAIVFTATCSHARRLSFLLKYLDLGGAVCLHGQMPQPARLGALAKFKAQVGRILIATDVAARGLDIPSVDMVINYDVPQSAKDYIHRVGRTARAGRAGKAVTIVSQYDVEAFQRIEHNLGYKLDPEKVDKAVVEAFEDTVAEAARRAATDMREEEKHDHGKKKRRKYRA